MKKLFKISLVFVICIMMTFFLVGCRKEKQEETLSRVTVDINPSIELIVDEENKVVSVTALNDDGNIIIVGETFIGKTSEEAVALIVSIATETGYLLKGEVEAIENEINISVSGDEKAQEELYNSIKKEVEKVISTEHIQAVVNKKEALKKEALEEIAMELDPTLTEEQVKEMTEQELLKVIQDVRLETAIFYSEMLVEMYNEQKAHEIKLVERAETKKVIDGLDDTYQQLKSTYNELLSKFSDLIIDVENAYLEYFVDPDCTYQEYYATLLEARADLILQKEKVAELDEGIEKEAAKAILETKQRIYNSAVEAVEMAYEYFASIFEGIIESLKLVEQQLIEFEKALPTEIKTTLTEKTAEIELACNQAKDEFFANFEEQYKDEIEYYKNVMQLQKDQLKAENK